MLLDNSGCQAKPETVLELGAGHIHIALITSGKLGDALISLVIASESGFGYLAVALSTPVLCIISRRDPFYTWRPGWGEVTLVRPALPIRALPQVWPYLVSVTAVLRHLDVLLEKTTTPNQEG